MALFSKPEEKLYGRLYGVVRKGRRIELHVYTGEQQMRRKLEPPSPRGSELLPHLEAWATSSIRSKYWLAQVKRDYHDFFKEDRVDIVMEPPK
jgi:hypothetical protein